MMDDKWY